MGGEKPGGQAHPGEPKCYSQRIYFNEVEFVIECVHECVVYIRSRIGSLFTVTPFT